MWNKFRYRMQTFMYGRYGLDDLGKVLFGIGLLFDIIGMFTRNYIVNSLSFIFIVVMLFRFFSKDISRRQYENNRFRSILQLFRTKFQLRKDYKVFKCKKCNRNVRIPRHHGKVEVTCPLCGDKKIVYTGRKH